MSYTVIVIYRFIFIASIVLLLFPFVGVYLAWKVWVAFGIGVVFFVYSVYCATKGVFVARRGGSDRK